MPINQNFIDIHCHPTMKAFGKSFTRHGTTGQSANPKEETSLWYYDPPTFWDKLCNNLTTLTEFRQADFSSSVKGETGVLFVCLYPQEQGFFRNKLGDVISDIPLNLITGLGKPRIDFLQSNSDYFSDLQNEYTFLKQCENKVVDINHKPVTYKIASKYSESLSDKQALYIVVTIEGAHSFFNKWDNAAHKPLDTENEVLANIATVKSWQNRPVFISLAHHFYNGLCGHAISLDGAIRKVVDQDYGSDFGISPLGEKVIHKLLEQDNRILVDVKHMNIQNRLRYYEILKNEYGAGIPVVVSHGAVNGYKDASGQTTFPDAPKLFCHGDINFFDDELVEVARSQGIFGIQLDERRIASQGMLWSVRGKVLRKSILYHWAKLVWNQIEHVAKVLDKAGQPAWDSVCLGSDYDGIVNPIGGYWTEEDMQYLDDNLLKHASDFMKKQQFSQKLEPEEIVHKFKCGNALDFLKRNY